MRIGVIARSELRGLGNQTVAVARHLSPERVLLVEPKPASWIQHPERLADLDVTHVHWHDGHLPEGPVRRWLSGLDVVYTAETVYDVRLPFWAAEVDCSVVRHANPEQLGREEIIAGDPTVWWAATPWRLNSLPAGARVVPMPVEKPPYEPERAAAGSPVRFVHPIGHAATGDRAGSRILSRALRHITAPCEVRVFCQDRRLDTPFEQAAPGVSVQVRCRGVDDHWDQYRGGDVLVLPRTYGGLSLPSQEAMAAGLALVMTDCSPNEVWPGLKVPVVKNNSVQVRCGKIPAAIADYRALADLMTGLAEDRDYLVGLQAEARRWAEANSWEALLPLLSLIHI